MSSQGDFEVHFTDREITAWGGMVLIQRMLKSIRFSEATANSRDVPYQSLIKVWLQEKLHKAANRRAVNHPLHQPKA